MLADIRRNIGIAETLRPSVRAAQILNSLREQQNDCESRLNKIHEQWPFPVAR